MSGNKIEIVDVTIQKAAAISKFLKAKKLAKERGYHFWGMGFVSPVISWYKLALKGRYIDRYLTAMTDITATQPTI